MNQLNYNSNDIISNINLTEEQLSQMDLHGMLGYLDESFEVGINQLRERNLDIEQRLELIRNYGQDIVDILFQDDQVI